MAGRGLAGRAARAHATAQWSPAAMEARVAAIYRDVVGPGLAAPAAALARAGGAAP